MQTEAKREQQMVKALDFEAQIVLRDPLWGF